MSYRVAIVGATGAVGSEMVKILEQRRFPIRELRLLATRNSVSKSLTFNNEVVKVQELTPTALKGIDIILSSAGAAVSRDFVPWVDKSKTVVIDNTSAFRMDANVPLVVPEVNPEEISRHQGVIANPNCSTIQMVVVLKPIHDRARIRRVVVSTYQAVSGKGRRGIAELETQIQAWQSGKEIQPQIFPHQIAFNVIPHIDEFQDNGYTKEEMKMVKETQKILKDDSLRITATTVRVPVWRAHSEAITIETETKLSVQEVRECLRGAPGIEIIDDPGRNLYPLAIHAAGKDAVFVGRIREDISHPRGIDLWVVADQLRKGAALNAIQIAEKLVGI